MTALIVLAGLLLSQPQFVVFAEPGFPSLDVPGQPTIEGALSTTSTAELAAALTPDRVLVWRHGSAFPAELWPAFLRFLEQGGSFLYLGGEPFTRPVTGVVGERRVEPRTVSLLKELGLNQCQRVAAGGCELRLGVLGVRTRHPRPGEAKRPLDQDAWVAVLEPRLADTKDFAAEDGAPGARDAIVRPFASVCRLGGADQFPVATASYAIDRLRGRYAGGRWSFHLLSSPPLPDELAKLLDQAARAPFDLRVDPTFGCFHEGERPSLLIRLHRPRAHEPSEVKVGLGLWRDEQPIADVTAVLKGGTHATCEVPLAFDAKPGLYRVESGLDEQRVTTGFWIFDRALFESGDALTFDEFTLRRNGKPEPVVGTTMMSGTVHRKFLFEPNAAEWDDTFAELAACGINMVRTGIWSAFRKISLDPNVVDESFLRALEAYYLSARRHGIPVLFTLFAFLPETFGGENPFLDPRAIEGQCAYAGAIAQRFANAKELLFDLINEPSFSSPDELWRCRPHGDRHEAAAFTHWLEHTFGARWQDVVRARWRLLPDEPIGLPLAGDFEDRNLFGKHRPYRARDYAWFAQDAFEDWIVALTRAIRDAGSRAAITVGQDEGGLGERPNPLFHGRAVDFTSMHTWWLNDQLLWDGVMARAPRKPLLISETGIMQREQLSGEALRDADAVARLLQRKLAYAFASGAFGVVQWCYEVNPYMASDNEVAIGLKRVDGSYKPEHRVLRDVARFVADHRDLFDAPPRPEVALVLPAADLFPPRALATQATQRAIDLLVDELGVPVQVVAEHRTHGELDGAKLLVLPACRGLAQETWDDVQQAVERGATLLCSGSFETDDAGLPALRTGVSARPLALVEGPLRYTRAIAESIFAASTTEAFTDTVRGSGRIRQHQAPLELASPCDAQLVAYRDALVAANITPRVQSDHQGLFVRRIAFRAATLLIAINESASTATLMIDGQAQTIRAGEAHLYLLDPAGKLIANV